MAAAKSKKFMSVPSVSTLSSLALFALRLIAGIAFMYHGWGKIQTPFAWMPPQAPLQVPAALQFLAAFSEFGGGLAWVLGLFTPIASLGIGITMSVAVYMHACVLNDPFVSSGGGGSFELPLVYAAVAAVLFTLGPGGLSLDARVFGKRNS
jgi:putative oxidoreductase